eukprot:Nk52_evm10s89 gene=Nk52_evmTU10s89
MVGWSRFTNFEVVRFIGLFAAIDFGVCAALFFARHISPQIFSLAFWEEEIEKFTFATSVLDLLAIAALRFLLLILFYNVIRTRSLFPVLLVTLLSVSYACVKFFYYKINNDDIFIKGLLVVSFILPCGQLLLWRKDRAHYLKAIYADEDYMGVNAGPEERRHLYVESSANYRDYGTEYNYRRARFLRSHSNEDLGSEPQVKRLQGRSSSIFSSTSSVNEFFTPRGSPPNDSTYLACQQTALEICLLDYPLRLEHAFNDVLENTRGNSQWTFVMAKDGVEVYHNNKAGDPVNKMKGIIELAFPAETVCEFVTTKAYQKEWNDAIDKTYCIEENPTSKYSVDYTCYKAPWPVSARDFVFVQGKKELEDGCFVTAATSVEHHKAPEMNGRVRGELHGSGFFIEPILREENPGTGEVEVFFPENGEGTSAVRRAPGRCKVSYVAQIDLKGWLSPKVVAKVNLDQPMCLLKLKKTMEKMYGSKAARPADDYRLIAKE